jgi:hypothetical protein
MVEGHRPDGVTITDIRPVATCGEPLAGTLIHGPLPGGGPKKNPRMTFDLDQPGSKGRSVAADGSAGAEYFSENSIAIAEHEQQVIVAEFTTQRQHCTFTIDVEASTGASTESVTVDTGGKTLAVTGFVDRVPSVQQVQAFDRYGVLYRWDRDVLTASTPAEVGVGG